MNAEKPANMRSRRKLCRAHCASCGCHFASQEAFDRHRTGDFKSGRYCVLPDEPELGLAYEWGDCEIYPPEKQVTDIWYDPVSREAVRERFG